MILEVDHRRPKNSHVVQIRKRILPELSLEMTTILTDLDAACERPKTRGSKLPWILDSQKLG